MRTYKDIREEWIHIRKIKGVDKLEVDFIKQATLGLIIDKVDKIFKKEGKGQHDDYLMSAIKSELKQTKDALRQGVECQTQVDILESLLPQLLSAEETTGAIIAIIARYTNPNMGSVMKELKGLDNIDMKIASKLVKDLI